jgi:hypothetical protein
MEESTRNMFKLKIFLLACIVVALLTSESHAEESIYMTSSPAIYAIAGLLIIDIGASLSNGFSLINDRPNKINGYFGAVTGAISLGLVAINFVAEEDDDLRNSFALTMGTAGITSLILGVINVKQSGSAEASIDESRISIYPTLTWGNAQKHKIGIDINISF